jgi:hypothetical protein
MPSSVQSAASEDDELMIQRINEEVLRDTGVPLDQLLNPSKVAHIRTHSICACLYTERFIG